jgi:hypothetical protein
MKLSFNVLGYELGNIHLEIDQDEPSAPAAVATKATKAGLHTACLSAQPAKDDDMSYECDNDNHDIGCQCPGVVSPLRQIRELHRPRPNSVSAMYPDQMCECGEEYKDCPTAAVLDAAGLS